MLKKLLALACCAALALSLTACGGEDAGSSADQSVPDQSMEEGSASSAPDASQPDASAPDMSKTDISQIPEEKPDPSKPKLPVEKPVPALKEEPKEPPKPQKPDAPSGNLSDLRAADGPAELAVTGILVSDPWSTGAIFLGQTNSGYSWEFLDASPALEGASGLDKGTGMTVLFDRASAYPLASYPASAPFTLKQVEKTFKAGCASYAYPELVANPDLHFGEPIRVTAQVTQVNGDPSRPDVHITAFMGENTDPVVIEYNRHSAADPIPAVGDRLNVYGFGQLFTSYAGADGLMVDVPLIDAAYLEKA